MRVLLYLIFISCFVGTSCNSRIYRVNLSAKSNGNISTKDIKEMLSSSSTHKRDSLVVELFLKGNFPKFLEDLEEIKVDFVDDYGKKNIASYFVLKDYISLGNNKDFIRIPMTPNYAQKLADTLGLYLSNRKICDAIYKKANVKLEPITLVENRTSFSTFIEHNDKIEEKRKGEKGLIAGIKKDVISTERLFSVDRMVAIYGWHKLDGKPIQSIYIKHGDYYVDYSHGIRMVYPYLFVKGRKIHFDDVLKDKILHKIISDEESSVYHKYAY